VLIGRLVAEVVDESAAASEINVSIVNKWRVIGEKRTAKGE